MAGPTVIECDSACTVTVVHDLSIPLLNLSVEDAVTITWQIAIVWAAAYCIRQVAILLNEAWASRDEEN